MRSPLETTYSNSLVFFNGTVTLPLQSPFRFRCVTVAAPLHDRCVTVAKTVQQGYVVNCYRHRYRYN
jgi:hypothetical protein